MPGLETRVLMQPPDSGADENVPQVVLANEWQDLNQDTRMRHLTDVQEAMVQTRIDDVLDHRSQVIDVHDANAVWVNLSVDSVGAPTDIRFIPAHSYAGEPGGFYDFVEGLWASMMYEDTDTADGIRHTFLLPCGGASFLRFTVVATGAAVAAYFIVRITVQPFRGNFATAHA